MASDSNYSYWEIFYNPDIPIWKRISLAAISPIVAPLVAIGSLKGCSTEDRIDSYNVCFKVDDYLQFNKKINEDIGHFKTITDGQNSVVIINEKTPTLVAQKYLDQTPIVSKAILNLFGIETPWKDLIVYLRDKGKRCLKTEACASEGEIEINRGTSLRYDESIFIHELSHAIRSKIAHPWWGLEEGLAVYTAEHLTHQKEDILPLIFEMELTTDEELTFDDTQSYFLKSIKILNFNSDEVNIVYQLKHYIKEGPEANIDIPIKLSANEYVFLGDAYFYFDTLTITPTIKMYQYININEDKTATFKSSLVNRLCTESGISACSRNFGSDGSLIEACSNMISPYEKLAQFERIDTQGEYYLTGYCFWQMMEDQFGAESVTKMVRSQIAFSSECEAGICYFPFFYTFMNITGLDEETAKDYFARFSAPIEDKWYESIHICE